MATTLNPPLENEELTRLFQYHEAKTHARLTAHAHVRQLCAHMAGYLAQIVPDGDEAAMMLFKVQEVMFWANAGIARAPEPEDDALMPTAETITSEPMDTEA